ncbi:Zn-ribbon domain-containing OB-fold protein [Palleronia abyssalis]|uniref:ChsH2 C-terminal OB-fold domain-containing protein n=1 Tax=Palleronia abyssalis TaxID=1501240 RepID=A0A2R8C0T7_9RHOB|nr:OB-fold domain-containing protein [Palleronia abyssalis]SPJ26024.1 hypothetical protein PAA8504_03880 [Palleronia abyssalis]
MDDTGAEAQYLRNLSDGRFMLQRDEASGQAVFPPRLRRPGDGAALGPWMEMSGRGTVHAVTIQQKRDAAPRAIILVDLEEGGRMLSQITNADPAKVTIGMPVRAVIVAEADPPHILFTPAGDSS